MDRKRPESHARESALRFLYQCEILDIYYFSSAHFENFVDYFEVPEDSRPLLESLAKGIFEKINELDNIIVQAANNWSLSRIGSIERILLRISVFELYYTKTPMKVVINECIELAKKYGSANSGRFVNGVVNAIAKKRS